MAKLNRGDTIAIIVLALALFSIVAVAWASAISNNAGGQSETYQGGQQNGSNDAQSPPEPIHFGLIKVWDTYPQWIMAILSLVATGISAWAVVLIRNTLVETRNAVKSADDAVAVTRQIGEAQVRPYIGLGEMRWISHPLRGDEGKIFWRFHFELSNTGQTPTRELKYKVLCSVAADLTTDTFDARSEHPAHIGSHGTLGVGILDVSIDEMLAAMSGEKRIYFICEARYGNMINGGSQHITRIGMVSSNIDGDPTKMWSAENNVHIRFSFITGFNCADDDCGIP